MIFNLPSELNKFDKYLSTPFTIFEKKNFIENLLFLELEENFPKENFFNKISNPGNKLSFDNSNSSFFDFLNTSKVWKDFYYEINNKKFVNYFFDLIKDDLQKIQNRQDLISLHFIKNYSNSLYQKIYRKLFKINYSNVRIGFQFSKIKKNCFIPPHCDVTNKLLSLMIYFPSINKPFKNSLGTNFFKLKKNHKKNLDLWDSKLMDKQSADIFFDNYEIFYKSDFEKNKLVGFIKSKNSWHNVDLIDNDIERNSVNINFYLL